MTAGSSSRPLVFDPTEGRPSVPIETALRLMVLTYRYELGFAPLCADVND